MLTRAELDATLTHLDGQYAGTIATDPRAAQYFCKLAVIEFCGWIEEAQDLLTQESATRAGIMDKRLSKKIRNNYGFHFEDKFAPLLAHGMGYKVLDDVVNTLSSRAGSKFDSAVTTINSFVTLRNAAAHTHYKPGGQTFYAPSSVRTYFNTVADGLAELEAELITRGW